MSCEENRIRYFERVSAPGGALANALGGESEARAALEQIFNTARNDGAAIRSPLQQHKAAGRTLQLFEEMEKRHGLSRPTHSRQGMRLPRRDAQFGYQAVYDTIEAARTGRALPDVATHVLRQRQSRRTLTSVRLDDHGYYRCSSCGQFASRTRGHVCPFTATSTDLERALQRRLGVPAGAYLYTDNTGHQVDALQQLIDAARTSSSSTVRMIHCLTGEEASVTLDGTIPALSQGFVPDMWVGRPGLQHVELPDRRVVAVLDARGLNDIHPALVLGSGKLAESGGSRRDHSIVMRSRAAISDDDPHDPAAGGDSAVRAAAAAYGTALSPGTHVYSLGSSQSVSTHAGPSSASRAAPPTLAASAGLPVGNVAAPLATPLARTGVGSRSPGVSVPGPPVASGIPVLLKPTILQGGTPYDWGHFTGTEYRKSGARGVPVTACGRTYKVGDRSTDPADWSSARRTGAEPAPRGGVAVGRTLVAAIEAVRHAQAVTSEDKTQLYNADGSELVAVYDHSADTAGDTAGTPNASPDQMAAVVAYWEHLGRANPDVASPAVRSLISDLDALRQGLGSPLAAADSAYLVLRDHLRGGSSMTLGAGVNTPRCPDCGRWMGDVHNCPARAQPEEPSQVPSQVPQQGAPAALVDAPDAPAPGSSSTPDLSATPGAQVPHLDQPSIAEALSSAFDKLGDRLGDRLGEKLGQSLGESLGQSLGSVLGEKLESLKPQQVPERPSPSTSSPAVDERMIFALDRLASILQERSTATGPDAGAVSSARLVGSEEGTKRTRTLSGTTPDGSPGGSNGAPQEPRVAGPSKPLEPPPLPLSPPSPPTSPSPPPRPPLEEMPLTPQEHILKHVKPPELPDPYLTRLDAGLGGQRAEPLPLHYEEVDPNYDVSEGAEKALRIVSSSLQMAWDPNRKKPLRGTQMRVFGFAGTAGTGKNTTARQVAASLRLPYYETTLHRDTSLQEEIGQTVLKDGTTMPRLGPLGQAAAAGGVICINELVKANPGTLGALQRMMEDGVFEVQGTEAGMAAKEIAVHPSTVFICTWNPGYDGSSDRPDAALLSRIPTIKIDAPDIKDETRRLVGSLGALFGVEENGENGANGESVDSKAAAQKAERQAEIFGQDYAVRKSPPSPERVEIAVRFVRDLRNLAQTRQIGASSRHLLEPTPREALNFAAMCEATGDPRLALEQFKIYCDSGEGYDEQFKLVQQIFKRYYGEDGQALNRRANGEGPQQS